MDDEFSSSASMKKRSNGFSRHRGWDDHSAFLYHLTLPSFLAKALSGAINRPSLIQQLKSSVPGWDVAQIVLHLPAKRQVLRLCSIPSLHVDIAAQAHNPSP